MQKIEPDSIPELRIMPWAIGFLVAFGLLAAAAGKRWMLYAWAGAFLLLVLVGLVDFYLWAYDYGHNLDYEHAPIKVPGMSYQPPIMGSKKLLNFTAHSWPALGGWSAFGSLAIGLALSVTTFLNRRNTRRNTRLAGRSVAATLTSGALAATVVVAAVLSGCNPGPEPFAFGSDQDAFCRMTITDPQFATQIVTLTGRVYKFDSVECMRGFINAGSVRDEDVYGIWVTDSATHSLIQAEVATYVRSGDIHSPMGGGLIAFAESQAAESLAESNGGQILDWGRLVALTASDGAVSAEMHTGMNH